MKKAFTLVELLVVIGIMGLLGTISVGGYRAMQRGMAERGVMENVDHFIRAAYQRAQIDRQMTAIYFWNETLRKEDDYSAAIVVGRAVAVRRSGRISRKDGQLIYDEFADLERSYATDDNVSGNAVGDGTGTAEGNTMYLYPMDSVSDVQDNNELKRSIVYQRVYGNEKTILPKYLSAAENGGNLTDNDGGYKSAGDIDKGEIVSYAFKLAPSQPVSVDWKPGMAYGFEFAELELPHGYIFGTTYSSDINNPVQTQGTLVFTAGRCSGNGIEGTGGIENRSGTIRVSVLRPNESGAISAEKVDDSTRPTEDL